MTTKQWTALMVAMLTGWFALNAADATSTKKSSTKKAPGKKTAAPARKAAAAAEAPVMQPEPALVKADNVNVRGKASFVGEVITKLKKGEKITILEEITLKSPQKDEPAKWYRIAMPASTPVWIHAGFVDTNSTVVSSRKLNVRSGPGENYSVVAVLQKGDAVKEIRRVNDWVEIETPINAYAFVSTELIARQAAAIPAAPTPPPETVVVTEPKNVVTQPVPQQPAGTQPTQPITTEPVIAMPPPYIRTPASGPLAQPLPKRVVRRDGVVKNSMNIQAPSPYVLVSAENGEQIDYLVNRTSDIDLKLHVGFRVTVVGEEALDRRWKNTPVLYVESLELP